MADAGMPDLGGLSDDQLHGLSNGDMSGLSEAQLHALAGNQISTAEPSAGSALSEGLKGAARGLTSAPGMILEGGSGPQGSRNPLLNWLDPALAKRVDETPGITDRVQHKLGIERDPKAPTSDQYAGTVGEFVGNPVSYLGPGGPLSKLGMATASGVGSEAAGQATKGTEAEPFARVAGAIAGGPLAARVIKPRLGPQQQTLADAGVSQMTPGQLFPGPLSLFKSFEDAATSVPLLGSFIKGGRGRSIEGFQRAVGNQALDSIGERLATRDTGHPLVAEVERKLGNAYERLLPQLQFIPDRQLGADMTAIRNGTVRRLPLQTADQFERIVDHILHRRGGAMDGRMFKEMESELTHEARAYSSSSVTSEQRLGSALGDVVTAMRQNLERANPGHADELARINLGWAMFARIRDAAARRVGAEGEFMPSDLLAAIKNGDSSVRKGSFARGDALMQTFAEAGQHVLPSKMPTSGTSERLATMGVLGGASVFTPKLAAAATASIPPYTRLGMNLLNRWASPTVGARASYREAGEGVVPKLRAMAPAALRGDDQKQRGGRALPRQQPHVPAIRTVSQRITSAGRLSASPLERNPRSPFG